MPPPPPGHVCSAVCRIRGNHNHDHALRPVSIIAPRENETLAMLEDAQTAHIGSYESMDGVIAAPISSFGVTFGATRPGSGGDGTGQGSASQVPSAGGSAGAGDSNSGGGGGSGGAAPPSIRPAGHLIGARGFALPSERSSSNSTVSRGGGGVGAAAAGTDRDDDFVEVTVRVAHGGGRSSGGSSSARFAEDAGFASAES